VKTTQESFLGCNRVVQCLVWDVIYKSFSFL
jgi:hypothetical protein